MRAFTIVLAVVGAVVLLGALIMLLGCGMMDCDGMMKGMTGSLVLPAIALAPIHSSPNAL